MTAERRRATRVHYASRIPPEINPNSQAINNSRAKLTAITSYIVNNSGEIGQSRKLTTRNANIFVNDQQVKFDEAGGGRGAIQ